MEERIQQLEDRIAELEKIVSVLTNSCNTATESLETLLNTSAENATNLSKFIGLVSERFSMLENKPS